MLHRSGIPAQCSACTRLRRPYYYGSSSSSQLKLVAPLLRRWAGTDARLVSYGQLEAGPNEGILFFDRALIFFLIYIHNIIQTLPHLPPSLAPSKIIFFLKNLVSFADFPTPCANHFFNFWILVYGFFVSFFWSGLKMSSRCASNGLCARRGAPTSRWCS